LTEITHPQATTVRGPHVRLFGRRLVVTLAGLVALAVALGLRWVDPEGLSIARFLVFDRYQKIAPRMYEPAPVRVVAIDEESLRRFGQWPWPRHVIADLLDRLTAQGAAAIGFDIVFAEPDRTSPARIVADWALSEPARADLAPLIAGLRDHDERLAEAIANAPTVLGMIFHGEEAVAEPPPKRGGFAGDQDVVDAIPRFDHATRNLPILEEAARGFANFSYLPERDGIVRRTPLLSRIGDIIVPSISVEALRVAQGAKTIVARSAEAQGEFRLGAFYGLNLLRIGDVEVPMAKDTQFWLHYTAEAAERTIPAWRVLQEPESLSDRIDGQIMLVGATAPGLRDLRATPLASGVPGIYVHAQALEQMILGRFLTRPGWADAVEFLGLALTGLVFVFLLPLVGPIPCAAIGIVAAGTGAAGSWFAYSEAQLLVDPLYPAVSALIVYLVVNTTQYLLSERERQRVRSTFGRYLSPALVSRMAESGEEPQLGGEMRPLTLFFCDIRGFTPISESMTPIQLTQFINKFLTPMTNIIIETGGTIDKYMGDAIMAFWNAPLDEPDHAPHAVGAALRIRAKLEELVPVWQAEAAAEGRKLPPVRIGMGLNTGDCVVGNMGSDLRFDYSCLGDTVNTASRLEGQSKMYGTDLVVSEETARLAPSFAYLELDLLQVKGKSQAVRVFTVLGDAQTAATATFTTAQAHVAAMLAAYRAQDWETALRLAEAGPPEDIAPNPGGLTGLYAEYAARIRELRADPPGPDWNGVYEAKTK
jgi:adenylate cyclase